MSGGSSSGDNNEVKDSPLPPQDYGGDNPLPSTSNNIDNHDDNPPSTTSPSSYSYSSPMNDYCNKLESWLWEVYYQRGLITSAYFQALNTLNPAGGGGWGMSNGSVPNNLNQSTGVDGNGSRIRFNDNIPAYQRQQLLSVLAAAGIGGNNGPTATVSTAMIARLAPVWKRVMAEVIDFLFLLVVKLFITFTIIDSFDLIDLDNLDLDALRETANAAHGGGGGAGAAGGGGGGGAGNADSIQLQTLYDLAFSLTSELLLLEFTHRIVVCFFEAYCLWKSGTTPGKTVMGLRVIQCDENILPFFPVANNNNLPLPNPPTNLYIIRPGGFLSFPRAFLRSALKNFSLAFFFPLCFTLFHFDHSRTLYDIFSHSVVVEMVVGAQPE